MPDPSMKSGGGRGLHPPFAQPGQTAPVVRDSRADLPAHTQLPDIEQFLDELPLIDDFLIAPSEGAGKQHTELGAPPPTPQPALPPVPVPGGADAEGWAPADWQAYDWSGVAALGAPEPEAAEAHASWASTVWESASQKGGSGNRGDLAGHEVAAALDEIAQRIRTGELSLAEFSGSPPEAALAALFAAFLRNKG